MASDAALGQLLRYLGWVRLNLSKPNSRVRGFVISSDIDRNMGYAVQADVVLQRLCCLVQYRELGIRLVVNRDGNDCRAWVEELNKCAV